MALEGVVHGLSADSTSGVPADVRCLDRVTLDAAERLRHGRLGYRAAKRTMDVIVSATALASLSWLFAVIALLIKLDLNPGPVFFVQERVGRDGRKFNMVKFRTMVDGAESLLPELMELNERDGPAFKMAHDPRVTRVGRLLRKLSIDELPEFWNVLKGEMTLVGPRPALPAEVDSYSEQDRQRLACKQGMTCFWQTRLNRDSISFSEWMELDRLYIRKCSMWTDIKLVIQTVGVVLAAQGR